MQLRHSSELVAGFWLRGQPPCPILSSDARPPPQSLSAGNVISSSSKSTGSHLLDVLPQRHLVLSEQLDQLLLLELVDLHVCVRLQDRTRGSHGCIVGVV